VECYLIKEPGESLHSGGSPVDARRRRKRATSFTTLLLRNAVVGCQWQGKRPRLPVRQAPIPCGRSAVELEFGHRPQTTQGMTAEAGLPGVVDGGHAKPADFHRTENGAVAAADCSSRCFAKREAGFAWPGCATPPPPGASRGIGRPSISRDGARVRGGRSCG